MHRQQCADKLKGKLREARRAAKEDLEETRLDYEGKMQELISQKDSEAEVSVQFPQLFTAAHDVFHRKSLTH